MHDHELPRTGFTAFQWQRVRADCSYLSNECLARRTTKFPEGKTERLNEGTAQLSEKNCKNVATDPEAHKMLEFSGNLRELREREEESKV